MASSCSEVIANVFTDQYDTFQETNEYNFTWVITNLHAWMIDASSKTEVCSAIFPSGRNHAVTWYLQFVHTGQSDQSYCSLCLMLQPTEATVSAKYVLSMINSKNVTIVSVPGEGSCTVGKEYGSSSFIQREKLLDKTLFPDDKLIISCKITATVGFFSRLQPGCVQKWHFPTSDLVENMGSLLGSGKYGDVTITVSGQKFLAYKGILAARSPVFAAMFSTDMQESAKNSVKIPDIEPAVFKELLRFIYTGQVNELGSMAYQLYSAADKYEMLSLRMLCREAIMSALSKDSVAETLKFADVYSDDGMKASAIQFLSSKQAVGVTETAGWMDLVAKRPHLANEVVEAVVTKLPD